MRTPWRLSPIVWRSFEDVAHKCLHSIHCSIIRSLYIPANHQSDFQLAFNVRITCTWLSRRVVLFCFCRQRHFSQQLQPAAMQTCCLSTSSVSARQPPATRRHVKPHSSCLWLRWNSAPVVFRRQSQIYCFIKLKKQCKCNRLTDVRSPQRLYVRCRTANEYRDVFIFVAVSC